MSGESQAVAGAWDTIFVEINQNMVDRLDSGGEIGARYTDDRLICIRKRGASVDRNPEESDGGESRPMAGAWRTILVELSQAGVDRLDSGEEICIPYKDDQLICIRKQKFNAESDAVRPGERPGLQ